MSLSQPKQLSLPVVLPQITKAWSPKLLANLNGEYDIKIAKLRGEYVFHAHPDTDEFFYIVSGTLIMKLREDGHPGSHGLEDVVLNEGDVLNVPKGMRHCPATKNGEEVVAIMVERVGTINSGDAGEIEGLTNEVEDLREKE